MKHKRVEDLIMIKKSVKEKIDRTIKEVWLKNISNDYFNYHILKEDTLKNSFYYHIRRKLGTKFLEENNIRIFTEFNDSELKKGRKADIAIVEIGSDTSGYIGNNIKSIIAIIELKLGGYYHPDEVFYDDINKVKEYINYWKIDCLFYLGFIAEKEYDCPKWLNKNATNNWADKKVTVLSANYDSNNDNIPFTFYVQSCNQYNKDLSNVHH